MWLQHASSLAIWMVWCHITLNKMFLMMSLSMLKNCLVDTCNLREHMGNWAVVETGNMFSSLRLFVFQPLVYSWCNEGSGMYHPVIGAYKAPPPPAANRSPWSDGSGFPLVIRVWSLTIRQTQYDRMCRYIIQTFVTPVLEHWLE